VPGSRYQLGDRVAESDGWTLWRGFDLVLRRPVAVLVVSADNPRRQATSAAAVRAGSIRHPDAVHVYDVGDTEDGDLQVIREWVDAPTLTDRLASGALDAAEACRIGAAVGRILGESHRIGLAHGRLGPGDVMVSEDGRVRVLGVAIAAALAGEPLDADDERRATDARAAAAVTYAAVTGRWPGRQAQADLPDAPTSGGRPVRARQVRAGVPASLDTTLDRLLDTATDADVTADELEELIGRLGNGRPPAPAGEPALNLEEDPEPPAGRLVRRTTAIVVSLVVLVTAIAFGSLLLHDDKTSAVAAASTSSTHTPILRSTSTSASSSAPVGPVVIRAVKDFDPEGDGSEKPDEVDLAVDGDLSTSWHTLHYRQAGMAPKHGVGLLLDLGNVQAIGAVRLDLVGAGTDLQIRTSLVKGATPTAYALLGSATAAGRLVTVQASAPVRARYVLVWLTRLPPAPGGFRGGVTEVTVLRS
jgi:hypothetical protein